MRLKRLSDLIVFRWFTVWMQWVSLIITGGIVLWFNLFVFPSFALDIQNQGISILDVRLFYTASDVQNLFLALGQPGRQAYSAQLLADMVYPFAYSLLLHFLYVRFCLSEKPNKISLFFAFAPYGALLADLAENYLILRMLAHYPVVLSSTALLASMAGAFKWFFVAVALGSMLCCLFRELKKLLVSVVAKCKMR